MHIADSALSLKLDPQCALRFLLLTIYLFLTLALSSKLENDKEQGTRSKERIRRSGFRLDLHDVLFVSCSSSLSNLKLEAQVKPDLQCALRLFVSVSLSSSES